MTLFKSTTDKVTDTNQPTLAQMWLSKRSSRDKVEKDKPNSDKTLFKSPNKFTAQLKIKRTNSNDTNSSKCTEQESDSGDDDVIKSSQETNESWLRKKIKNLSTKPNILTTPQKTNNIVLPGSVEKQLSIGDVCDVSSNVIKEELNEMYENIDENNSIEMTHDLSGLITDDQPPPSVIFGSPPAILSEQDMKVETMSVDMNNQEEHLKDPLQIDEENIAKNNKSMHVTERKRRASVAKLSLINDAPKKVLKSKSDQRKSVTVVKKVNKKSISESNKVSFNLSEEELQFLKNLEVQLQHEVPPQHTIERLGGSRAPTEDQIIEFESYQRLKKGVYSESEDEVIRQNWENFCKIHGWDLDNVEPFLYFRHNNQYYISNREERVNFVKFLANGLPWRTLYSVYNRFRNLNSNSVNGPYSEKEDQIIMDHLLQLSNDTAMTNEISTVAKLLKRKRHSVWQRFQKIKKNLNIKEESYIDSEITADEGDHCKKTKDTKRQRSTSSKTDLSGSKNNKSKKMEMRKKSVSNTTILSDKENRNDDNEKVAEKKKSISIKKKVIQQEKVTVYSEVKWACPLVNRFVGILMNVTSTESIMDLKDAEINESVWKEIENQMSIDKDYLKNFWYSQLHMQIFCPRPLYLNDLKMDLIEIIHDKEFTSFEDIESDIVFSKFKGVTTYFLSTLVKHLLVFASSKTNSSDFRANIEYLFKSYLPELEDKRMDKVLPKLYFKNGKIVHVDKGSEKRIPNRTTTDPLSDDD